MGTNNLIQLPPDAIPERCWDVLVVGAGPAGATAALYLCRSGRSVLMVDGAAFPRDKVCGGGLVADSLSALKRAGLYEAVLSEGYAVNLASGFGPKNQEVEVLGESVVIKRSRLDFLLARRAAAEGACFLKVKIGEVRPDGKELLSIVSGSSRGFRSRVVIIAAGAELSLLGKTSDAGVGAPSGVAVRCYGRSHNALDRLVFSFSKELLPGYGWIFPLGDGEFNIGCGVFNGEPLEHVPRLRENFSHFVEEFHVARELLSEGSLLTPLRGGVLRCGLNVPTGSLPMGVLAIGETAGTTFPFSGEGIGKAMESGEIAAAAVNEALADGSTEKLDNFSERLRECFRPAYAGYEAAARWSIHPALVNIVFQRARKNPALVKTLANIATEDADPTSIFSWKGVIRSFLS